MEFMTELLKMIDLPSDIIMRYRYTVMGGRAVYIAGHKGIKVFGTENLELKLGTQIMLITGTDLIIRHLSVDDMIVTGVIASVTVT